MSVIYLAGPIDYGTNDSDDRQSFIDAMSQHFIIYDATTTFRAPLVEGMTIQDMKRAISIHHAAIESANIFVADMRKRSVGIPIEMWLAYEQHKPIFVLYDKSLPASIYIESSATHIVHSWAEMEGAIALELQFV